MDKSPRIRVELRHLQPLYEILAHRPDLLAELESRGMLQRVPANDLRSLPLEARQDMALFLHAQGEPHYGAQLAARVDLSAGEGLLYFARSSETLREMLAELIHHQSVWLPGATLQVSEEGQTLRITLTPQMNAPPLGLLTFWEGTLTWLRRAINFCLGQTPTVLEAWVMTPPSAQAHVLEQLLGCTVQFGADCFGLRLPLEWLSKPLPGSHAAVRQRTATCFDVLGRRQLDHEPVWRRVLDVIEAARQPGDFGLEAVAAKLQLTPSTLRRHLAQEGSSFSALLEAHRRQRAFELMVLHDCPVELAAQQLGYSGRVALGRAFRGWFAGPPARLRRHLQALQALEAAEDWASPLRLPAFDQPLAGASFQSLGAQLRADPVLWAHALGLAAQARFGAQSMQPDDDALLQQLGTSRLMDAIQARAWMLGRQAVAAPLQARWQHLLSLAQGEPDGAPLSSRAFALLAWAELGTLLLQRVIGASYVDFRSAWAQRPPAEQWAEERRRYGLDRHDASYLLLAAWGLPTPVLDWLASLSQVDQDAAQPGDLTPQAAEFQGLAELLAKPPASASEIGGALD